MQSMSGSKLKPQLLVPSKTANIKQISNPHDIYLKFYYII